MQKTHLAVPPKSGTVAVDSGRQFHGGSAPEGDGLCAAAQCAQHDSGSPSGQPATVGQSGKFLCLKNGIMAPEVTRAAVFWNTGADPALAGLPLERYVGK
jgi:hypothetical protein